jgi:hypothetical protein
MNSDEKLDSLFRAARATPAAEGGGYGFETHLLAGIREERRSSFFGIALRLSPLFAALVVAAAAWSASFVHIEPDATYAWDAVRSGAAPVVEAWLSPEDR